MELKIILLLASIYLFLKAIASVQRSLYFDRLALEDGQRRNGQRPDWIIDPKETEKED